MMTPADYTAQGSEMGAQSLARDVATILLENFTWPRPVSFLSPVHRPSRGKNGGLVRLRTYEVRDDVGTDDHRDFLSWQVVITAFRHDDERRASWRIEHGFKRWTVRQRLADPAALAAQLYPRLLAELTHEDTDRHFAQAQEQRRKDAARKEELDALWRLAGVTSPPGPYVSYDFGGGVSLMVRRHDDVVNLDLHLPRFLAEQLLTWTHEHIVPAAELLQLANEREGGKR